MRVTRSRPDPPRTERVPGESYTKRSRKFSLRLDSLQVFAHKRVTTRPMPINTYTQWYHLSVGRFFSSTNTRTEKLHDFYPGFLRSLRVRCSGEILILQNISYKYKFRRSSPDWIAFAQLLNIHWQTAIEKWVFYCRYIAFPTRLHVSPRQRRDLNSSVESLYKAPNLLDGNPLGMNVQVPYSKVAR